MDCTLNRFIFMIMYMHVNHIIYILKLVGRKSQKPKAPGLCCVEVLKNTSQPVKQIWQDVKEMPIQFWRRGKKQTQSSSATRTEQVLQYFTSSWPTQDINQWVIYRVGITPVVSFQVLNTRRTESCQSQIINNLYCERMKILYTAKDRNYSTTMSHSYYPCIGANQTPTTAV